MKTVMLVALIPYLVTGHADSTTTPTPQGTLYQHNSTSSFKTKALTIEILLPITPNIKSMNLINYNKSMEFNISATSNTSGIETVTTVHSTDLIRMELDMITNSTTTDVLTSTVGEPRDKHFEIYLILGSSDIAFNNVVTLNDTVVVSASVTGDSRIQEVITVYRTSEHNTTMEIQLLTFRSRESSSSTTVPSTPSVSFSSSNTRGELTSDWYTNVTSGVSPTPGYCDREYSCVSCTTARICAPLPEEGLRKVFEFPCPDFAPWCDSHSGTCSAVRTPECDLPVVGNFTCMRNGRFPDPDSCSDYYVCDNDLPLEYSCLHPSPYYSPLSQSCVNSSSDCLDYQSLCKGFTGLKVAVPRVNNLFLFCGDGAVQVVDRCIGANQFSLEHQGCVPECPHAGLFPSDQDCAGYYRCSPSPVGEHYVITNLTCPQGMAFLESAYDCVNSSLVPNCILPYMN